MLCVTTMLISICSDHLADSLSGAFSGMKMGKSFFATIILPIVSKTWEHSATICFALQNRAELSIGIAVGSSVQMVLFVIPFSVVIGWALGGDEHGFNMDLNFNLLDVTVL